MANWTSFEFNKKSYRILLIVRFEDYSSFISIYLLLKGGCFWYKQSSLYILENSLCQIIIEKVLFHIKELLSADIVQFFTDCFKCTESI